MNLPTNPLETAIFIIIIIIAATIFARLITAILNKFSRLKDDMTGIYLIRDIIIYVVYFIALLAILQLFGINLYGTLLSLGIVGIAVSLAAKDLISNLFSGIILIIGKSIRVGDTIEINKSKGVVESIRLRTTTIKDDDGIVSTIPNSTLTNNLYKSYKAPEKYRVDILAGLSLDTDLNEFADYIIEKINELDGVLDNPKPKIFSKGITFEETNIKISFWIKDSNNKDDYKLKITNEIRKFVEPVKK
jgi:small-conductance mechanosensitive channel